MGGATIPLSLVVHVLLLVVVVVPVVHVVGVVVEELLVAVLAVFVGLVRLVVKVTVVWKSEVDERSCVCEVCSSTDL